MLEKAAKKARDKGFDVPLVQCDFRELSGRFDRQFDCVMSTGSALGHVTDTDVIKTIHEMDKLIIPGGWLYFDSRNWDAAKKNTDRFIVPQPFYKEDGTRIGCVQMWDYNADGTITINIVHSYEKDRRIFDTNNFQEHLHPFSLDAVKSELYKMGYSQPEIRPCPWFEDKPFDEIGWYCLMARKPG